MSDLPKTRAEAKALGLRRYFTGRLCANGHLSQRSTRKATCLACQREFNTRYFAVEADLKRELNNAASREYRKRHRDLVRERSKRRPKNPAGQRIRRERYVAKNRERYLALAAAAVAARRSRSTRTKLGRMHLAEIKAVYQEARRVSTETGVPHEVDHVIPLFGRTVSGLHVPWNLQILPKRENRMKSNKFDISEAA